MLPAPSTRVERFLANHQGPTPFLVMDVDVVAERYVQLAGALPGVRIHYAVKANPGAPVLERLCALGSAFDVASPTEIDACLQSGVHPDLMSYGNPAKKRRDIAYASSVGVRRFTVDSCAELAKVAAAAPGSSVLVRLAHDCGGADWPLSRKFGCSAPEAVRLLVDATAAGLSTGLAFHVGSQQRQLTAWDETLEVVAAVFAEARELGARPSALNLGGGFPGTYRERAPSIEAYGNSIRTALRRWRLDGVDELLVEPGRYLVADAGVLRTEVVLVSERMLSDVERWVYLDCGKFGGLAETMDESIRYRLRTGRDGGATGPVAIAGPTCDSADVLYEKSSYELPLDLAEGDLVDILSAGAYTATYASVGFNGFAPLHQHYV